MARRSVWLFGALGVLAFGGLALASAQAGAAAPPRKDDESPEGEGEQPDQDEPTDPKGRAHLEGFRAALKDFAEASRRAVSESAKLTAEQKASGGTAAVLTTTIGAASAAIPVVGQIIAAAAAIFALMFRELGFGAFLQSLDGQIFTGWRRNTYAFKEVPIYGPRFAQLRPAIEPISTRGNPLPLDALQELAKAYPYGPPVEEVLISDTGDYRYLFNPSDPGNLSQEARDANKVFGQVVYSPADITPTGPRGFNPADPLGWKVPGQRRAKLDDSPVKLQPGKAEAGL